MSPKPVRQNTEAELAAYDRTCERLAGFDPGLDFETIDGFLASLAALPQPPEPERWLPAMCGDAWERTFADPQDQAQALASLQARLVVLRSQLDPEVLIDDPDQLRLDPLIAEITDEDRQKMVEEQGATAEDVALERTGVYWAEGFLAGVAAFEALWEPPAKDDAPALFQQAFDQIHALLAPPDSDEWMQHLASYYPKGEPTRDELLAEACMAVQDLRLYWVDFAPVTETRRVEPTPGRNDPCPCGSGKKYKKCHGAA